MDFHAAVNTCFQKYVEFNGRATRSEYWYFVLFLLGIGLVLAVVDGTVYGFGEHGSQPFSSVFSLVTFLPSLAVAVRRLHDIGRSGWWILIALIPLVGAVVLIVWMATESDRGANEFGPDPKAVWA